MDNTVYYMVCYKCEKHWYSEQEPLICCDGHSCVGPQCPQCNTVAQTYKRMYKMVADMVLNTRF